jgi:acetyl-CoA acetyltransferase
MSVRDVAIAGIGASDFYRRGGSHPRTVDELIGIALLNAVADAGLTVRDLDGFAYYSGAKAGYGATIETASLMQTLGIPEVGFSAALTMGGGGSAGAVGLAAAAIRNGDAQVVAIVMGLQQSAHRLGTVFADQPPTPSRAFFTVPGMAGPGVSMAPLVRRHMHKYGTRREAFAEVAISSRMNAMNRPKSLMRQPLTLEDYFNARMVADPLCLFDFCQESDGAVAIIVTSAERARDLRAPPVHVHACVHGGGGDWAGAFLWHNMPDDSYASSGHRGLARRLFDKAGMSAADIDVALLYDHFAPLVVMQLEDYGFCAVGEGGPFVESGVIRMNGAIPVNPHGGHLSDAYVIGLTHVMEAIEQLRGTAINQVDGAEVALVTGGPAPIPVSSLILRR